MFDGERVYVRSESPQILARYMRARDGPRLRRGRPTSNR